MNKKHGDIKILHFELKKVFSPFVHYLIEVCGYLNPLLDDLDHQNPDHHPCNIHHHDWSSRDHQSDGSLEHAISCDAYPCARGSISLWAYKLHLARQIPEFNESIETEIKKVGQLYNDQLPREKI